MAQLIQSLAIAGARDSSGNPVSSGVAWFFEIGGGSTQATVYSDEDGTVIATQPVVLDAGGRAVVFTVGPVRMVIQDSTFADVSDVDQVNVNTAEAVRVDSASWTDPFLDEVLDVLGTSVGGTDGKYLESSGATARTIKSKFSELSISVKDFGAKGDGLQVDTTAVQAAINRVAFLGGGEVYFPPGTYLTDQLLTCATSGVSLRGAGRGVSIIKLNSATLNGITFTGCTGFSIRDLELVAASSSSGTGITFATCTKFAMSGVYVHLFYVECAMTSGQYVAIRDTELRSASTAGSAGRSITLTDTSNVNVTASIMDCLGASSKTVEVLGSSSSLAIFQSSTSSTGTFVYFATAASGNGFRFVGNGIGGTAFGFADSVVPLNFFQRGNGIDGSATTSAVGNTQTPVLITGPDIKLTAASGGAGTVTVGLPAVLPISTAKDVFYDFTFVNAAGGAVTWTLNGVFVVSAAIPTTDAHTIGVRFRWDGAKLREVSRADTVT